VPKIVIRTVLSSAVVLLSCVVACSGKEAPEGVVSADDSLSAEAAARPSTPPGPSPVFHRGVGAPVDQITAKRWMENLTRAGVPHEEYRVGAWALRGILAQGAVGISLGYAVDDGGRPHLLPVGVDGEGKAIRIETVPTEGRVIPWETARQWRARYAGATRSHFFGADTFERLIARQGSLTLRVERALNDRGEPQLLLSNADDIAPSEYEDASLPCPDHCGPLEELQ
jgi:hypothetical protein